MRVDECGCDFRLKGGGELFVDAKWCTGMRMGQNVENFK